MKRATIYTAVILVCTIFLTTNTNAQKFNDLDVSPMDIAAYPSNYRESNKQMKIIYSRPQLKGRSLSKLTPYGNVWRTGANEATELILYKDFKLGETTINAGTYTFATIPGEKEWTIIINSDLNTWGAYFYNKDNDVARINVPVTKANTSIEAFSIAIEEVDNGITMFLGWDTIRIAVPFTN